MIRPDALAGPAAILVVDDKPNSLAVLRAILAPLGHRVETADSSERALALLLAWEFDLLICDVRMPRIDGFHLAGVVRGRPATAALPILFISGDPVALARACRGDVPGPVDCLEKPFRAEALWQKVRALLGAPGRD